MDLLPDNRLEFAFPEVHPDAVLHIEFQRTLRVPDDGQHHHLPPGLGRFPLRAVDELDPTRVPAAWRRRGGVAMPMWQAEACWLRFSSPSGYPFLLKVAAGRINAVNGAAWRNEPDFADQDYVEVPRQPWLDGFRTDVGTVRQFIAMPLGRGYTVEEQVTGKAEWGGVQLLAHPLKAEVWERRQAERPHAFFLRDQALACAPASGRRTGTSSTARAASSISPTARSGARSPARRRRPCRRPPPTTRARACLGSTGTGNTPSWPRSRPDHRCCDASARSSSSRAHAAKRCCPRTRASPCPGPFGSGARTAAAGWREPGRRRYRHRTASRSRGAGVSVTARCGP